MSTPNNVISMRTEFNRRTSRRLREELRALGVLPERDWPLEVRVAMTKVEQAYLAALVALEAEE